MSFQRLTDYNIALSGISAQIKELIHMPISSEMELLLLSPEILMQVKASELPLRLKNNQV